MKNNKSNTSQNKLKFLIVIIIFLFIDLLVFISPFEFLFTTVGFDNDIYKYLTMILLIVYEVLILLKIKFNSKILFIISFIPLFLLLMLFIYYFIISCHIETKSYLEKELGLDPKKLHVKSISNVVSGGSEWNTTSIGVRSVDMVYYINDDGDFVYINMYYNRVLGWDYTIYDEDNSDYSLAFGTKEDYYLNKKTEKKLSNIISKYTNNFTIYSDQSSSYTKYPKYSWNYSVSICLEDKLKIKNLISELKKENYINSYQYGMDFYFFNKKLYDTYSKYPNIGDPKLLYYHFASFPDFDDNFIENKNFYKLDTNIDYELFDIFYHYKIEKQTFATITEFNVFGDKIVN